jgi:hypothetical protein
LTGLGVADVLEADVDLLELIASADTLLEEDTDGTWCDVEDTT